MPNRRLILASLFAAVVAFSPQAKADPVAQVYLLTGRGMTDTLKSADLATYTDIVLSFAHPDTNGQMVNGDAVSCMPAPNHSMVTIADLQSAIDFIHTKGKRAVVSLGGAVIPSCAGDWATLMDAAHRPATVQALSDFAGQFKLDGIDVDLESELMTRSVEAGNYVPFVMALSAALHARGKSLSVATGSYVGGMVPLASLPAFDRVGVMAYDDNTPGAEHASMEDFKNQMYLWLGRGVPKDRLVMGLPFYGHGYGEYAVPQPYHDIVATHAPARNADVIGTPCAACSYITFNSPATIAAKTSLALRKAAGVMVWELWQDTPDHSLTQALADGLAKPAPYPVLPAMPELKGTVLARFKSAQWQVSGAEPRSVADKAVAGGRAIRISAPITENPWDVTASLPITSHLKAGRQIAIVFWARVRADDPDTQFAVPVTVEGARTSWMQGSTSITTTWRRVAATGSLKADLSAGAGTIQLMFGAAAKVVDLGPAELVDLGEARP